MWDPSGAETYDCLYYDWDTCQPLPEDGEMFDFALPNGLTVATVDPLKSYRMSYKGPGCELELTWDAIAVPHEIRRLNPEEMNPGIDGWLDKKGVGQLSTGHYEQAGRVRGTVNLEGEILDVDCFSMRDHTWGPRPIGDPPRACYHWAIASEADMFYVTAVSELPIDEDPIRGTTERVVTGFYIKDGIEGHLVSGTRRVVERDDDGRPRHEVIDAIDDLGRTLHADGYCRTWLKWTLYAHWFDWWALTEWEFDGLRGWGEVNDYFTFRQSRRLKNLVPEQSR